LVRGSELKRSIEIKSVELIGIGWEGRERIELGGGGVHRRIT